MSLIKSLNMSIASKTLTDRFTMQTYATAEIDQVFTGAIKDFNYTFKAGEVSSSNGLNSVAGIYDIDDILNKGVRNLFVPPIPAGTATAVSTMQALAITLNKTLNIDITDFYPADWPDTPTGKELISAFFGWTDKIPQRQINVFIRGDVINVLERGKETATVDVLKYANVIVSRKKIRTLQDAVDVAGTTITGVIVGQTPRQDTPTAIRYISGVFINGDTSITYTNGLVTRETHTVNGVDEVTTYEYSSSMPPAYLTSKSTTTAEGHIDVNYYISNEKLTKEVEKHYTGSTLDLTRTTRHYPIGQGMWGTSIVEDDGTEAKTTYGGISQGAPGGKASAYSIQQNSANPNPEVNRQPPMYYVPGRPYDKYLGSLPVTDSASMALIAADIIWLDKKTEVRVSMDAYADTIFDLSKKILWQGDTYYLESNNISVDPDKTVQKLELIRWV